MEYSKNEIEKIIIENQTLKNNNLVLSNIINTIDASIYWKDLDGKYLGANTKNLQYINMDLDQVIGKTDYEIPVMNTTADQLVAHDKEVARSKLPKKFEEVVRFNDNEEIVLTVKSPLRNLEGDIFAILGISIDITERKKQEAEIIRQKNQLEKKLKFQHSYLKSAGYEWVDSLKAVSNAVAEIEHRLRRLDIAARLEYDLNDQFYILNESLSELYTMYHKLYSTVIGAEENIKYFDQKHEIPLRMENLIKTEVDLAESCISAEFDVNVSYEMDEKSKQKLDVDYRKLQHILRTLFANYTKGINKTSRKEDIRLSITAEDGYHDTLYVTFDFKGPLPFVEVEEDEIRAEHMVYKSQTRVALDKHDFAYDVSLAMHYADVLCGNEDLNEHLFEGPYFSFTLPFRKTEDDGKGKKPHLFVVE
jgi:PAS domain S-box-containing protein